MYYGRALVFPRVKLCCPSFRCRWSDATTRAVVQEPEKLSSVLVADVTESTYFVPETMSVWNVLEEVTWVGLVWIELVGLS